MSITPITNPLPGEHVIALSPQTAAEAAIAWLARPNVFPGRALTAPTLQKRQRWQAGRVALRGQSLTSGVIRGLEVGHEQVRPRLRSVEPYVRLVIAAGLGLAASGENVVLARPAHVDLLHLPVYAEPSIEAPPPDTADDGDEAPEERNAAIDAALPEETSADAREALPEDGTADARAALPQGGTADAREALPQDGSADAREALPEEGSVDAREALPEEGTALRARVVLERDLATVFKDKPGSIERVGVLVLQPVAVDRLGEFDPTDPCELAPCGQAGEDDLAFSDWRIADGVRVVWYAWPNEWVALPAPGPAWRNEIAWTIFRAQHALGPDELLPWEMLGVPLALIALDDDLSPLFIDRASVVREGGRARDPRLSYRDGNIAADWRRPALFQAQIEQLAEAIAASGDAAPATLRETLEWLPPAGLVPRSVVDLSTLPLNDRTERLESAFFPASFELDAVPVPLESLDLSIREAAPLAPLRLSEPDRVRVLVPVPQALYEPRLLIEELIDPEFDATLQRFLLARSRALGARHGMRRTISELVRIATGRAVPVPKLGEDPAALETETIEPWGPPPPTGGHRSDFSRGLHQHAFQDAAATHAVGAADTLFVWVYLDPDRPPRELMLQWRVSGSWEHRAYWSASEDRNLIDLGVDNTASRRYMGELPAAGKWTRLEVTAVEVAVGGFALSGMAFTLFAGRAAYGASGTLQHGTEHRWFSSALPSGAVPEPKSATTEEWVFLSQNDLWAPFEADFGLDIAGVGSDELGGSTDIKGLLEDDVLAPVSGEAGVLSAKEREQLGTRGLEGFIAMLKSRADRADDLVDYGFVKVQADTYRIRQLMLGTTNATKLAVSPALATIAQGDTAPASQQRIATFLDELKPKAPQTQMMILASTDAGAETPAALATLPPVLVTKAPLAKSVSTVVRSTASGPYIPVSRQKAVNLNIGTKKVLSGIGAKVAFTPQSVINASPLVGKATIRTTTIAQRLQDPKAVEARNYATATRHDSVQALQRLALELMKEDGNTLPGLFAGVNVYGLDADPFLENSADTTRRHVAFRVFVDTPARVGALLNVPDREGDEAAHFSDSADIADNTIAFLRQMEGRIQQYRNAAAAAERVLEAMREDIGSAQRALKAWDETLAEARHDVAVARALIAEENERLAAINRRRAAVIQDVRFLAYIRPREVHNLRNTPLRELEPGLIDAPVPACLAEHNDVPDELEEMLAVLREAPVAWFPAAPKLVEKLDRMDLVLRAVQNAQSRSVAFAAKAPPMAIAPMASGVRSAIDAVKARNRSSVGETRQLALNVNIAQLASLSWQGARQQAVEVVSLGDLIDGEHGKGEIARKAAELFDRMSRIAGCLHAEFSAVVPSIRLDWAEVLSQFDRAPGLRDLSVLARWSEIDFVDRKQMQAYADWLFDQVDARVPAAEALMNDVVRMCLLLAADAPIGRILAGRLPRPVVARPGVRIPLTAFDTAKLRVGMHALVYQGPHVAARAVVEDIGSEVSARVVYTHAAEVSLGTDARVQFADAAQVTVKKTPAARARPTART